MLDVAVGETAGSVTERVPEPGRYRHFKGGEYELLSVGKHTETGELLVVYRSLDRPSRIWVRPLEMFVEPVERSDGTFARFEPAVRRARSRVGIVRVAQKLARKARAVSAQFLIARLPSGRFVVDRDGTETWK
jgi:hypothetical protein